MSDLIDTTEMYLKAIYELIEDGVRPMRARIAERLDHSGPTVSQTVARMERDGLLRLEQDRHLTFTELGEQTATRVMRKHRLAERLLVDVIGLDPAYVHDEACRWEHVMSDRVEVRILGLIQDTQRSPYGNPIPGLEELGSAAPTVPADGATVLEVLDQGRSSGRLVRIGEPAQVEPETLDLLLRSGIVPGAVIKIGSEGQRVRLHASGHDAVSVPDEVASHLFVVPAAG
ncbi:MAG TPA: iron dependent repressor, metal binding and dimerization domain protein [Ornithinimicrobium sp.]|uniref:metal-dependent transcriptional regulator n=1 Tax=Ornithinimicrobium sp. TaxID=1977084 RepID=UPI002B4673EE|nr:iron dependent repressor, metal binding and dimerization domain protein [Ornithinimicrobium sp.]HKJ10774.1 iron dependent repressor, metal binding and dimerization domain protein [Ornithinimicrobium sp.]